MNISMEVLLKLTSIIAIFACGFLILVLSFWLVAKKRFSAKLSVITIAFGAGLGFGLIGFLSTFIDEKSQSWAFIQRLSVSGEIFLWAFVGSIVVIPVAQFAHHFFQETRNIIE